MKQATIATSMTAQGSDPRCGTKKQFSLHPAKENSGIRLCRIDSANKTTLDLNLECIAGLLPDLQHADFDIFSFLPLLAVLRALNIDNVEVHCEGPSLPHMGESASVLLFLVQSAGITQQNALRKSIHVHTPVALMGDKERWVRFIPGDRNRMVVLKSKQQQKEQVICENAMTDFNAANFVSELCHARSEQNIESEAKNLLANGDSFNRTQELYSRLAREKGKRYLFNTYSLFALLPYPIKTDYVSYNAEKSDSLKLIKKLLENKAFEILPDWDGGGNPLQQSVQHVAAI